MIMIKRNCAAQTNQNGKKKKKKGGRQIQKNTVVTIKTDAHTIMCLSKNNETILATFSVVINAYSH